MSSPVTVNNARACASTISGLLKARDEPPLGSAFLWSASCLLLILLFGATFLLGGIEAGTILLAGLIGAAALAKPRSALWASTAFMVYLFVFFQKGPLVGPELPAEFYYWGAGVATITLGLCIALLRVHRGRLSSARSPHQIRFDRAMLLIFLMSLVVSICGVYQGNSLFPVARQLFGCLLLPTYYLFGRSFFRTAEDVDQWLHRVTWAVVAGAVWYVAKLSFISLSEGAYYREQSPLATSAGAIGAVLFVELLQDQRLRNRIRLGTAFAFCALAMILMGARLVAGSLAATAIVFAFLRWRTSRPGVRFLTLFLLALAIPFAAAVVNKLLEEPRIPGQIAGRFFFRLEEDSSYIGRVAQWQAVADVTKQHPILGAGMGSELPNFTVGWAEMYVTAFVDNGWGFVLLKMGLVGLSVFLFLIGSFLWFALKGQRGLADARARLAYKRVSAILLFGLLSFIGGPTFFHFTQSAFLGTAFGGLAVLAGTTTHPDGSGSSKACPVLKAALS